MAVLPLLDAGDRSAVPVTLDGQPYALIVDTGATHVALTSDAALHLALNQQHLDYPVASGIGGMAARGLVDIADLRLGGLRFREFNVPVIPLVMPQAGGLRVAGVLGASVLQRYDVELDFPGGRMILRAASYCAEPATPASGRWSSLPLATEPSNLEGLLHHDDVMTSGTTLTAYSGLPYPDHARLFTVVWINERPMIAIVDTGASVSALTPGAAARAGLSESGQAASLIGVDAHPLEARLVRAARVVIGQDARNDVAVGVADMDLGRADMILGHDLMRDRRLLISFTAKRILWQAARR